jgi:N-ethylmaleimide reductase
MKDSDPVALFNYVLQQLSARGIAYAHLIEPRSSSAGSQDGNISGTPDTAKVFRSAFKGVLISAVGYDRADAMAAVSEGRADAVAFGRLFISNPDLPARLESNRDLNAYDRSTFYGGAEKGYTDYPSLG